MKQTLVDFPAETEETFRTPYLPQKGNRPDATRASDKPESSEADSAWVPPQFGFHHDLHVLSNEKIIATRADAGQLAKLLGPLKAGLLQVDTKGHEGFNSYRSNVASASYPEAIAQDLVAIWRETADQLGARLHCHHSGIEDEISATEHPDWAALEHLDGTYKPASRAMDPLGPYAEQKLIPQLQELVTRFKADGVWIDGEVWGVRFSYHPRVIERWKKQTGLAEAPTANTDKNWPKWIAFQKEIFEEYVSNYVAGVKKAQPQAKVCSNWLYSFRCPGEPRVKTDWLSGDNAPVFGQSDIRMETRFLSTRGRPWELVLWNFYVSMPSSPGLGAPIQPSGPWVVKPAEMLMQEAGPILAYGGGVMIYEQPKCQRDGQMVPWHLKRLEQAAAFIRQRQEQAVPSQTFLNAVVLHSEAHYYSSPARTLWEGYNTAPVRGAINALLHLGVPCDILDEWALLSRINQVPLLIVPEQDRLSDTAVQAIRTYVEQGGKVLLSGVGVFERFGADFIGASNEGERYSMNNSLAIHADQVLHAGTGDEWVPISDTSWRLIHPTTARVLSWAASSTFGEETKLEYAAATTNQYGKGEVIYIPTAAFEQFELHYYPQLADFINQALSEVILTLPIVASCSPGVEVIARKVESGIQIHLCNELNGMPPHPRIASICSIPTVGPITVTVRDVPTPRQVSLLFEESPIRWTHEDGNLEIVVEKLAVHASIAIALP